MSGDDRMSRLEARIASIEALQNAALGAYLATIETRIAAIEQTCGSQLRTRASR